MVIFTLFQRVFNVGKPPEGEKKPDRAYISTVKDLAKITVNQQAGARRTNACGFTHFAVHDLAV